MILDNFAQNIISKLNLIIEKIENNNSSSANESIKKSYKCVASSNVLATPRSSAITGTKSETSSSPSEVSICRCRIINVDGIARISITGFNNSDYSDDTYGYAGEFRIKINEITQKTITITSTSSKNYTADIPILSGDIIEVFIRPSYSFSGYDKMYTKSAWTVSRVQVLGTISEGNISPNVAILS